MGDQRCIDGKRKGSVKEWVKIWLREEQVDRKLNKHLIIPKNYKERCPNEGHLHGVANTHKHTYTDTH